MYTLLATDQRLAAVTSLDIYKNAIPRSHRGTCSPYRHIVSSSSVVNGPFDPCRPTLNNTNIINFSTHSRLGLRNAMEDFGHVVGIASPDDSLYYMYGDPEQYFSESQSPGSSAVSSPYSLLANPEF